MVSKEFNLLCQDDFIWKKLIILRINNINKELAISKEVIDNIIELLKDICFYNNHIQLPRGYFREISKKFIEMERVHFIQIQISQNLWMFDLDYKQPVNITIDDQNDEILCFTEENSYVYFGHKNSKITVFF